MRKLFFLLLLSIFAYAQEQQKLEIYAGSIDSQGNQVRLDGDVSVVYGEYFLHAKRALYNRQNGELELFGDVRANYAGEYKLLGKYARLNVQSKEKLFRPFYMLEKKSRVWLSGNEGCGRGDDISIDGGVVSGCDPKDPLWKMEFSSSQYNTQSQWLNLYNARFNLYDILVFYTPYFGYSLDTTRATGLLVPTFGLSSKEGFYYEQAFFIAEQNWWDLELKPQIRTSRGEGIYSELRFVDSKVSRGSLRGGYFREKPEYALENKLLYEEHSGFNLKYDNKDVINQWTDLGLSGQSGLYLDINNMSDVDYLNLSSNNALNNTTATQVLSRANLFYNTELDYFGVYARYYKDLTLENNENTLQKLPTLHYHSYLDTLFNDTLYYHLDVKSDNIYRQINTTAIQTNINVPITLQTSLFDEYLLLSYTSDSFAQHSDFSKEQEGVSWEYNNGFLAKNSNEFRASTLLAKAYEEKTHVIDFGLLYTTSGLEYRSGFYKDYKKLCGLEQGDESGFCENEFYNITNTRESLQIDFTQFLYNLQGEQALYHRIAQTVSYEKGKSLGELENELEYQINRYARFYTDIFYNYDAKKFSKALNQFSFSYKGVELSLSHLYRDTLLKQKENTSYFTSTLRYTYNDNYSYRASLNYDLQTRMKKSSEIGFMYKKRCWDFGLSFVENTRPILTRDIATSSSQDRYLMISIILKPFMSTGGANSDFALRLPETMEQ